MPNYLDIRGSSGNLEIENINISVGVWPTTDQAGPTGEWTNHGAKSKIPEQEEETLANIRKQDSNNILGWLTSSLTII